MLIVICGKPGSEYLPERKLIDTSWDATVGDIASGELTDIHDILHSGLDVSVLDSVAKDVMTIWADRSEGISTRERDFIERALGIQVANQFRAMEAAE